LNEEAKIADTVNAILPLAHNLLDDFEVVLVDDGSTDRTGLIMDQLKTQDSHVTVIHHAARRGLGMAIKEVTQLAKFEFLVLIPGDDAYRHDGIEKMFGGWCGRCRDLLSRQSVRPLPDASHPIPCPSLFPECPFWIWVVRLSGCADLPGEMATPDIGQGRRLRFPDHCADLVIATRPYLCTGSREPECGTEGIVAGAKAAYLLILNSA
jgi:glycosyltransferase involved in cell wall biosynthesis